MPSKFLDGLTIDAKVPADISLAIQCVRDIFQHALASGDHKAGDWRNLPEAEIRTKMITHLAKENFGIESNEDELGNAACRVLMLLQLREERAKRG